MKRVLITGKMSYIGRALEDWLEARGGCYQVDVVDMQKDSWRAKDFSLYDVVYHVAGIAHIKETKANRRLYYKVNRDLAYETALKAKGEGVGHFIFLSSMSVYGLEEGFIDSKTIPRPASAYGQFKYEAEGLIRDLEDEGFVVAILRPPMVYGRGCRGNYPRLAKLAQKTPVFPRLDNRRSMIYVDNLSEAVRQLIDERLGGLFFPQNTDYVSTSDMVGLIAKAHGRSMVLTSFFNPLIRRFPLRLFRKLFSDLVYDQAMSSFKADYRVSSFRASIMKTEGKDHG